MLAGDVLIQLNVAVADALNDLWCHLRNNLTGFPLEVVLHQPLAYELLGELLLGLTLGEALCVSLRIEIARGVGCMDLIHQVYLAVVLAELIFCVHQDQASLSGDFRASFEQR